MTTHRFFARSLSFLGAASLGLLASAARAECVADGDCEKGFTCQVVGVTACAEPACPPGEPCPAPEPCVAEEFRECMPGPCTADSDCAEGMACLTETYDCKDAPAISCPPGEACPEPAPCEPATYSQCVPKYALPCTADADCGEGFDCVPEEIWECAGSGGSAGGGTDPKPTPGAEPMPLPAEPADGGAILPPECTVTQGTVNYCRVKDVSCATSADCPASWTCEEVGGYSECSAGGSSDPSSPPPEPVCTTTPGELKCVPPFADVGYPSGGGGPLYGTANDGSGAAEGGEGRTPPTAGAPGPDKGATAGADPTDEGDDSSSSASSSDDGGCQMGAGRASSSGASLL
ncbi:MAG: hypothetical protein FJ104_17455, partial [Deltaproteobacteria bacterium]|nr:hypothetical protein [Deltaproteobacteria bacterium]